jgi:hypothetical protein
MRLAAGAGREAQERISSIPHTAGSYTQNDLPRSLAQCGRWLRCWKDSRQRREVTLAIRGALITSGAATGGFIDVTGGK